MCLWDLVGSYQLSFLGKTIRGDIQSSSNGHPPIAPKAHGSKDSRHARLHEEKLKMMCAVHRKTKKTIVKSPFVTIKMNY